MNRWCSGINCCCRAAKREPSIINDAEAIPICGGLLNTAALDVATDFDSLYEASLEMTRVLCRMEVFCYYRSRATEISEANWGWTVVGITAEKLQVALNNFQRSMVRNILEPIKNTQYSMQR